MVGPRCTTFVHILTILVASHVCGISRADEAPDCSGDSVCCEKNLSAFGVLRPEHISVYGDKLVELHPRVKDLPLQKKNCHEISMFVDKDDDVAASGLLYDYCSSKCQEKDISIMTGTGWFGLNLQDGLEVCLGSTDTMSAEDEEFCTSDEANLCNVEEATVTVASSLLRMTYASLAMKSSVAELVREAKSEALDEENQELLQDKTDSEMGAEILRVYSSILEKFSSEDGTLSHALSKLKDDLEVLQRRFQTHFDDFLASITKCNRMIPRASDEDAIFYDVCSQQSTECIESPEAEHVSCCCVYNPMAQLPGLYLDQPLDLSACTFFDLCSEHRQEANSWIRDMGSLIDSGIYDQFEEGLSQKYGESFRTWNLTFSGDGTDRDAAPAHPFPVKEVSNCTSVVLGDLQTLLPASLQEKNNSYRDLQMIYDFEGEVVDNFCDEIYENRDDKLFDRCEEFCGSASVPLLVGSPKSGVNIDQALSVCFDEKVVGSAEEEQFCSGPGRDALEKVQTGVAELASNLIVFRATQLVFVDLVRLAADRVRDAADSQELKNDIQRQNTKEERVKTYKDFYQKQFATVYEQAAVLVERGESLKQAFGDLKQFVDGSLHDLQRYASNCSKGFPRTVQNQAMLALCPVSGSVCADDVQASYVYCCCSTNALLASPDSSVDVCSHAKNMSGDLLAELKTNLEEQPANRREGQSEQADFASRYYAGMSLKYGEGYDPPLRLVAWETFVPGDGEIDQGEPPSEDMQAPNDKDSARSGDGAGSGVLTTGMIGAVGGGAAAAAILLVGIVVAWRKHVNAKGSRQEDKLPKPPALPSDAEIFWEEREVVST